MISNKVLRSSKNNKLGLAIFTILTVLTISSCSLIKIESDQEPLGLNAINTRLLTQNFAKEALDRIEIAADSIKTMASDNVSIQLNTLDWKIKTSEELGRISFQTEPKVALLDTWAYFLEVERSFLDPRLDAVFGPHKSVALAAVRQNIEQIEGIAATLMRRSEFESVKTFVEDYAESAPLLQQKEFKHSSIRESYLRFKNIPDSVAVKTIGSLSEVVANASSSYGFNSNASDKRFNWKAEKILKEKGLDSVVIEQKLAEFDAKFDRLLQVAEDTPENIGEAITEFRNSISPLFRNLNLEIRGAVYSLSDDVRDLDKMLARERFALDSIIARERIALTTKADELVESGIESTITSVERTIKSLLLYFILFLLLLIGLPFYIGYRIGKHKSDKK